MSRKDFIGCFQGLHGLKALALPDKLVEAI